MKRIAKRSIAIIVAGLIVGMLTPGSHARADESVGSVSQVSGSAQIQRGSATLPAQQGAPVMLHDKVSTQPDASLTLAFADGSSLALSGGTSIVIEESTNANGQAVASRVTLISGDIHTIVPDKTTGQQHRIEVNTENAKVTGTTPNQ
jgi:hypothetical protein